MKLTFLLLHCSTALLSRAAGGRGGSWDILRPAGTFPDAKVEKRSSFCDRNLGEK